MLCRKKFISDEDSRGSVPVYLNVYDLTPMNGYAYWLGLGVYHSGVQVHGIEYAFGAHEYPTTGIFEGEPKQCDGFTFRKTILIGKTEIGPAEVRAVMEELAEKYRGNAYNLITKNCNHFCNDACIRLTGFLCNCVLPANLNSTKVQHHKIEEKVDETEKKKLTSESKRFSSSSNSSSPSGNQIRGRSRSRRAIPPSSPLISSSP
ncbi:deSI-like protein At4g17486 isoform X2 [Manihot esculenta]|uniref:Uncharacterized protein n=1 Tax=Manihot esculenta TaxID=3983 RepID=A0ACB7GUC4_MANES|nr:deSI-like protein At4g17486 isoform X2 [Manihot esculenta]KAG8643752.1 hypothetical protein MANES_11G064400v8 [Manihot esculenta]